MVVTMQESFRREFASSNHFGREEHQERDFRRSNRIAVCQFDAHYPFDGSEFARSSRRSPRLGSALLSFTFTSQSLPAAKFMALIAGIFLLYEPIKTLSRMHIMMQRSIAGDDGNFPNAGFRIERRGPPDALTLPRFARVRLSLEHVTFRYAGGVDRTQ